MIIRLCRFILPLFLLCFFSQAVMADNTVAHVARKCAHFTAVDVSDDIVVLITNGKKQHVVLKGDPRAIEEVSTTVSNGTLYIKKAHVRKTSAIYNPKVIVDITTPAAITGLYTTDRASIIASNIRTHGLILGTWDHSTIKIHGGGSIPLRTVNYNSSQNLVVPNVHTKILHVYGAGTGKLTLTGNVSELSAYLYNRTCLSAYRLTAGSVYVHTEDGALAMVTPLNALYAFAFNFSNVYYSRTPRKLVVRTQESGNVLKAP